MQLPIHLNINKPTIPIVIHQHFTIHQPIQIIRTGGYNLIPIDMPNQIEEARKFASIKWRELRDPRGFPYHSVDDRLRLEIINQQERVKDRDFQEEIPLEPQNIIKILRKY